MIERLPSEGGLRTRIAPTPRYDPGGTSRAGFRPCLATATLVCHPTHLRGFLEVHALSCEPPNFGLQLNISAVSASFG